VLLKIWEEGLEGITVKDSKGNVIEITKDERFEATRAIVKRAIMRMLTEASKKSATTKFKSFKKQLYEFLVYGKVPDKPLTIVLEGGTKIFRPYITQIKLTLDHLGKDNHLEHWSRFSEVVKYRSLTGVWDSEASKTIQRILFKTDRIVLSQKDAIHELRNKLSNIFLEYKDPATQEHGIKIILVKPSSMGYNLPSSAAIKKFIPDTPGKENLPITFSGIKWGGTSTDDVVGVDITDLNQLVGKGQGDKLWAQLAGAIFVGQCIIIVRGINMDADKVLAVYDPQLGIIDPKDLRVYDSSQPNSIPSLKYSYYNDNDKYAQMIKKAFNSYNHVIIADVSIKDFKEWYELLKYKVGFFLA